MRSSESGERVLRPTSRCVPGPILPRASSAPRRELTSCLARSRLPPSRRPHPHVPSASSHRPMPDLVATTPARPSSRTVPPPRPRALALSPSPAYGFAFSLFFDPLVAPSSLHRDEDRRRSSPTRPTRHLDRRLRSCAGPTAASLDRRRCDDGLHEASGGGSRCARVLQRRLEAVRLALGALMLAASESESRAGLETKRADELEVLWRAREKE